MPVFAEIRISPDEWERIQRKDQFNMVKGLIVSRRLLKEKGREAGIELKADEIFSLINEGVIRYISSASRPEKQKIKAYESYVEHKLVQYLDSKNTA